MLNLFDTTDPKELIATKVEPYLSQEWIDYLDPNKLLELSHTLKNIDDHISSTNVRVYPSRDQVFRAFDLTPPDEIKAVIVSKCPYPNENADGIPFSCAKYPSQSLRQIYCALADDRNAVDKKSFPYPLSLESWCKQGVLMLNVKLIVKEGDADSFDTVGFQSFIGYVCQTVSRRNPNVPFLLLGADARKPEIVKNFHDRTKVFTCDHPVNASRNNEFWSCNGFEAINDHLIDNNQLPIKWV